MTSGSHTSSTSRANTSFDASSANKIAPATGSDLAASGQTSFPPATKSPSSSANASGPANMSAAVGGAPPTHGHSDSMNGKNTTIPAIPSVTNGNVSLPDHTRKPSMTVTPAGATTYNTNGGAPSGPQNKPGIQFGSIGMANPASSPGMGTPPTMNTQNSANLGVQQLNPRTTSPSNSPSPIPQPASVSGGGLPQGLSGQGNGFTFGRIDQNDPSVCLDGSFRRK
jgi:translation initiation factor 4G